MQRGENSIGVLRQVHDLPRSPLISHATHTLSRLLTPVTHPLTPSHAFSIAWSRQYVNNPKGAARAALEGSLLVIEWLSMEAAPALAWLAPLGSRFEAVRLVAPLVDACVLQLRIGWETVLRTLLKREEAEIRACRVTYDDPEYPYAPRTNGPFDLMAMLIEPISGRITPRGVAALTNLSIAAAANVVATFAQHARALARSLAAPILTAAAAPAAALGKGRRAPIQRMEAILGVDLDGDGIIGDPNAKAMSPATRAPTGAPASSAQASTSASTSAVPTVMATTTLDAFCALCNNGELLVEYMQSELERRIDESGGGAREARAAPAVAAPPATPELEPVLPPSLVASSEGAIRAGFVLITTPKSSLLRWAGAKSPHISSNLPRSHSSDGLPSPFRACVWPLLLQAPVHARTC